MKFRYHFFHEENVVIVKYYGDIYLEDLYKTAEALYSNRNYKQDVNGISDFRHCKVNLSKEEIKELLKLEVEESRAILTRWAIIVDNPQSTVAGFLYEMLASKHKVGIFSTWQGAASFQNIKLKDSDIKEILKF